MTLALLAYTLDLLIGELPCKHPVMFMGDFIQVFEKRYYQDSVARGGLLVLSLLVITWLVVSILVYLIGLLPNIIALPLLAVCASTGLAMNMLHSSVAGILTAENPKQAVSYLVSRDTEPMTETEVYKAGLETWAENLSDGVIAPLFYLTLFGLQGIAIYKAINTLDSMIGYKTPHYFKFGKVAARLDDIANYIPARITALLIVLVVPNKMCAWRCLWRDGNKLDSPNAGFPIAAMAGGLGIALGGDTYYHGQLKHKPVLGNALHEINAETLKQGLALKIPINVIILGLLLTGIV